jgi:SHS2 domain-containing protein
MTMDQTGRFRFENVDHTADKAIVAYGATFEEMLESAAAGMFAQHVELASVSRDRSWRIFVEADSAEDLLIAWLRELLLLSEGAEITLCDFSVTFLSEWRVEAVVWGSSYTGEVLRTGAAVKAITYHGLSVVHGREWGCSVTFDV